jgi:hypothetical protein
MGRHRSACNDNRLAVVGIYMESHSELLACVTIERERFERTKECTLVFRRLAPRIIFFADLGQTTVTNAALMGLLYAAKLGYNSNT